ncbi:TniQ family protein [Paracoccus methylovorus]|uniref:TniQ family protein n=1 Tax=Paracoccus methylovorus TaxID=2812658 RepID=A0ABX7JI58_9RHOB|nr:MULTISPECIES: TniQ family protein [Paracoccus]QRZ13928.1 TniQ family protein [Paracoccus methylovorus]
MNGYPGWMARLPLSVHSIPGETATSLASRLAQVNQVPLREFLRDMGIGIHSLIAGERAALTQLAELSGVPVAALRQGTPRTSDGEAWFAGHRFPAASVGGREVRGCPDCLEAEPGLRGIWSLPFVTICPEHNRPLVTLWTVQDRLDRHEVTRRLPELDLPAESS